MSGLDRIDTALRYMKAAGSGFAAARYTINGARTHRYDPQFVRDMVRIARDINHAAVQSARAAREWVQP